MCTVLLPPGGYSIAVNKYIIYIYIYIYKFGSGTFERRKCEPEGKRPLGRPSCKWKENIIIIIIYLTANGQSSGGSGYYACT